MDIESIRWHEQQTRLVRVEAQDGLAEDLDDTLEMDEERDVMRDAEYEAAYEAMIEAANRAEVDNAIQEIDGEPDWNLDNEIPDYDFRDYDIPEPAAAREAIQERKEPARGPDLEDDGPSLDL